MPRTAAYESPSSPSRIFRSAQLREDLSNGRPFWCERKIRIHTRWLRSFAARYRARPELRVSNIRTQVEINEAQTVRERLLAALAVFFAGLALLLAGIGLYGVLDYSVLQRRRELGIRIAVGAPAREIARQVAVGMLTMATLGVLAGVGLGLVLESSIKVLLYQVNATDIAVLAVPLLTILAITMLAAIPAIIRGNRIDPVEMLRTE